ncbi:MAG: trigger factor [Chloroflexi bacterium GWC2_73_18]|nr:MAG: trigger factor [Chloroflexi bacterium GWC2_73_18]
MKVTSTPGPRSTVVLDVELPPDRLARSLDRATRDLARRTRVPGFRPGKAPRTVLERVLGEGAVFEEAVEQLIPSSLEEALVEAQVIPLDRPSVEVLQREEGKALIYRATVPVRPGVKLGAYRDYPFALEVEPVDDARIDAVLADLRDQQGTLAPVEDRPARDGDYVVIGFEGRRDGEPFEGGSAERYPLVIGADRMIPGFEGELVGMALDEEKAFELTFPADYPDEALAGRPVSFSVKMREIREKVLPELDDAFAQGVGDFADLAALRADVARRLEANARDRGRHRFADRIIEFAVANATLEVPDALVDSEVEVMHDELRVRLAEQGIGEPEYLQAVYGQRDDKEAIARIETGDDRPTRDPATLEAALHAKMRPQAERRVKVLLVLSAVADAEGISVGDAEVEAEVAAARARNADNPRLVEHLASERGRAYLRSTMRRTAVVERLVDEWLAAHPEVGPMPHLEDRTPVGVAGASETAAVAAGTPAGDPAGQPA